MKRTLHLWMLVLGLFAVVALVSVPPASAQESVFVGMDGDWEVYDLLGVESDHSYSHKSSIWWEVAYYGARAIKLHFKKFEMADSGDTVTLYNDQQVSIQTFKDKNPEGFWTSEIAGDRVLLHFVTNTYSSAWGFQVDQVSILR